MNLTLGKKIALSFAVCLLAVLSMSVFVYKGVLQLKILQDEGNQRSMDALRVMEASLMGDKTYGRIVNLIINKVTDDTKKAWEEIKKEDTEDLAFMAKFADTPEEKSDVEDMKKSMNEIIKMTEEKIIPLMLSGANTEEISKVDAQIDAMIEAYTKSADHLLKSIENEAIESDKTFDEVSSRLVNLVIGISCAVLLFILFTVSLLNLNIRKIISSVLGEIHELKNAAVTGNLKFRGNTDAINPEFRPIVAGFNEGLDSILKPVEEARNILENMAQKNFSLYMEGDYQGDHAILKNSINSTLSSVNETLAQVSMAVEEVNTGAGQVSQASQSLSQGATEQASSLEEITSSMHEIDCQTKQNAENSGMAKNLSNEAKKSSETGNEQMKKMITAMDEINKSSERIAKIIKVIDEIAFQTNLLALNAAVEAARAGKHGKGFAVVAEEVRNLAARSAKAAKETTDIIDDSTNKIINGTAIATSTAKSLEEIISANIKVSDLVGDIAVASSEQAQGVSQIVIALSQIDQVTQRNTASAEESASAASELSGQSSQLKLLIGNFKLKNAA